MGEDQLPCERNMFATPLSDVSFHPLTTGGVLSLDGSHRIWVLNDTSAFIWCILNEVSSLKELACRLMAVFPICEETALRDTEAALTSFEREGLLTGGSRIETLEQDESWDITLCGPGLVEPTRWVVTRFFRAANHVFEFRCADASLGEAFTRSMSHLEVRCEASSDTHLAVLSGQGDPQTWDIYVDGLRFKEGLSRNMVLPHLATVVFVRCCEALKERLLLHAAVVARGGRAVVFPGEAGSGKTTLAATLMANGCRVLSDELAVLNLETLCVSPLPLPMSIKSRSVEPLSCHYPGLADCAVHLRADGKKVRYLSPWSTERTGNSDGPAQIALIVFPAYRKGVENRLVAIDDIEAMRRLAKTGSSNRDLTHRDVEAMVSLVRSNPCFELVYTDVCGAAALLEKRVLCRYTGPE